LFYCPNTIRNFIFGSSLESTTSISEAGIADTLEIMAIMDIVDATKTKWLVFLRLLISTPKNIDTNYPDFKP